MHIHPTKIRFLGTGTSTGVPQIGCNCSVCQSSDRHDKRYRSSILVSFPSDNNILIDCGPDFYHQILRENSPHLSALLLTHIHYDHIGGMEDLRYYCSKGAFPVYCDSGVAKDLHNRLPYCFSSVPYPGSPSYDIHLIHAFKPFKVNDVEITPLPIKHYQLDILGFYFRNFAYITDCKEMPEKTMACIRNIDTLIINALRRTSHMSHLSLQEALDIIDKLKPRRAFLTHISHQMGKHAEIQSILPPNVQLAYDGLEIEIP